MRLSKIEIIGFKSFADRQLVVVDERVTGVIGPNGCGKSNIVDAIRWCMGEQSAKHLRGGGMADVIFAGCSTRGPAGMAEVTITFRNDDGGESSGLLAQPDVAITRRLYADGTSEYLINKVPARLRDIHELLMGTGVGTKGYSIIEQGQVGRIVSSKPEERRHIIDEAAGITRYKAQKAAAQRKIEATRQNLARVSDVVTELEGRLGTLRRQAQKAERYKRYREDLRDLDLWIASHKYLELTSTGTVLGRRHADLAQQVEDLRTALQARETKAEAERATMVEVEQDLATRQQTVYDLDHRIRLMEAEEDYRRREREGLVQSRAQSLAEAESAMRSEAQLREEQADVDAKRAAMGTVDGPDGHRDVAQRLENEARELQGASEERRRGLENARRSLAKTETTIARGEARRQSHEESLERVQQRQVDGQASVTTLQAELHELIDGEHLVDEALASAAEHLEQLRSKRAELDDERTSLREQVSAAEVALDTKRAEVHRHRSRLQSLEEIQSRYRSCNSGVQVVMEHQNELASQISTDGSAASTPGPVYGILADYLHTPPQLETAVSAVLGERLEGVVVDAPAVAARGVELLKREQEGRTTFVPRRSRPPEEDEVLTLTEGTVLGWSAPGSKGLGDAGSPFEIVDLSDAAQYPVATIKEEPSSELPGVLGRLGDLVELKDSLASLRDALFGDVLVVDSLGRALELWETHKVRETLVTLDGDRIEPTGVVVGGSPTALNSALLQQQREIRELGEIMVELEQDFQTAHSRHQALAARVREVELAREKSESEVIEAEKRLVQVEGHRSQATTDRTRVERALEQAQAQHAALQTELEGHRNALAELDHQLETDRQAIAQLESEIEVAERAVAEMLRQSQIVAEQLTEAKIALARWQQEADALDAAHERLKRQAASEAQRAERLGSAAKTAEERIAELTQASADAVTERAALIEQSKAATEGVHGARERFEALRNELDELDASMKVLRTDLEAQREQLSEAQLGLQEIELEREHLFEDVRTRFDLVLGEVVIDYHHRPVLGTTELKRQKELKQILARMGEVNLTAIQEFEEVNQRHEYLSGQRADLDQAIAQLQEAIDQINATTRELFRKTFEAVNANFEKLFPRLFGGGAARLKLTEPDDLLATGVEIEARPPGKQPRTLDLLSGGEKALTAVSLIFAIFLIKPSPFCLLDEVDAPLDDANVARFCSLVRELSAETQFIMITHNKVTMETADRLYGVTMEQRGVSKLVSVNLRRAVELAAN